MKILVVEDDAHTQEILRALFTRDPAFARFHIRVLQAKDGYDGIEIYKKEDPDVVITDLLLPRIDGFEMCRQVRSSERGRDVPLIVISAIYRDTAVISRVKREYAAEFFAKPLQVRDLARVVEELCSKFRPAAIQPTSMSARVPRSSAPRTPGSGAPVPGRGTPPPKAGARTPGIAKGSPSSGREEADSSGGAAVLTRVGSATPRPAGHSSGSGSAAGSSSGGSRVPGPSGGANPTPSRTVAGAQRAPSAPPRGTTGGRLPSPAAPSSGSSPRASRPGTPSGGAAKVSPLASWQAKRPGATPSASRLPAGSSSASSSGGRVPGATPPAAGRAASGPPSGGGRIPGGTPVPGRPAGGTPASGRHARGTPAPARASSGTPAPGRPAGGTPVPGRSASSAPSREKSPVYRPTPTDQRKQRQSSGSHSRPGAQSSSPLRSASARLPRQAIPSAEPNSARRDSFTGLRRADASQSGEDAAQDSQLPARKGDLAHNSPARLLLELHEENTTGTVFFQRGQMRRVVYFIDGQAVYADSNVRAETLGEFLIDRGASTRDQIDQALELGQLRKIRLGEALVQLEFLTESAAFEQIAAQVQMKIANAMRWRQGHFELFLGDTFSGKVARCAVELPRLIFRILPKLPSVGVPKALVQTTPRFARYRTLLRSLYDPRLMDRFEEGAFHTASLVEDLKDANILGQLRAIYEVGLLEISDGTRREDAPFVDVPAETQDRVTDDLYRELFGDMDSGAVAIDAPDTLTTAQIEGESPAGEYTPKERAARKLILGTYLAIVGKLPYEVLGISLDATPADVHAAYQDNCDRFRSQRFDALRLGPEAAMLSELLAMFRQAYEEMLGLAEDERTIQEPSSRTIAQRAMQAELLFREGEQILREGDAARAEPYFRTANIMASDQADYHAYLGWTRYLAAGGGAEGAALVAPHLDEALTINPELPIAREFAARVALDNGHPEKAKSHLDKLLELQPEHDRVIEWIEEATRQLGTPQDLERAYRKALHLLGDQRPERSADYLLRLSDLYLTWGDEKRARMALDAAAHRSPSDSRVLGRVESFTTRAGGGDGPLGDAEIDRRFHVKVQQGETEAALHLAAVLVGRGSASPELESFYRRHRPHTLAISAVLDKTVFARMRDIHDDPVLDALMAERSSAVRLAEPVEPPDNAREVQPSQPFGEALAQVARALNVHPPVVFHTSAAAGDAQILDGSPPKLLVSNLLLEEGDPVRIACWLARELYVLGGGRLLLAGRGPLQINQYLGDATVELDRFRRGIRRTGERLAALLTGDVATTLEMVGDMGIARASLEAFVLSDVFIALRRELGLAMS